MNLREAVANLIKVKGRHNTEIAYQKLIEAFDADKLVFCGCGDQIMPDDGAECGTCVTARNAVKQEPVAWRGINWSNSPDEYAYRDYDDPLVNSKGENVGEPLYIAPPQREWQGLTDEEVRDLWSWSMTAEAERTANTQQHAFTHAIEAKLKEKNGG